MVLEGIFIYFLMEWLPRCLDTDFSTSLKGSCYSYMLKYCAPTGIADASCLGQIMAVPYWIN